MNIREITEQRELKNLSPFATPAVKSKGRDIYEKECDIRTVFARDRDRIIHCKSFRRLKQKTQVFLIPDGDHYRTRLTHTLEVSQIARTIARALSLNEDLTEAIALGHDLGHTPFGHTGEKILNRYCPEGFEHCEQSLRVVEKLEREGRGLNLTWEVRDGILNHRTAGSPHTLEGEVVRLSDKIAYINHDIDDAIRADIIKEEDLPREATAILGNEVKLRIDTLIHDVVNNSLEKEHVTMSAEKSNAMQELRKWMFENVYKNSEAKAEEHKAEKLVDYLYNYYLDHLDNMPSEYQLMLNENEVKERVVCDYIAGMTDDYAIFKFNEIFVPQGWKRLD